MLLEVLEGLRKPQKQTHCKYLYDKRGSEIFDLLVDCEDYYPPRVEAEIMRANASEITDRLGKDCYLIEPGAGSTRKVRLLLKLKADIAAYAPIDISTKHLRESAQELARDYPDVEILPVGGDFTKTVELPVPTRTIDRRDVFFPGSTIGNFSGEEAVDLLRIFAGMSGPGGGLLIGVDLKKDRETLERAYDDSQGLSAAFNLNLLERLNRELGADFHVDRFRHYAPYREDRGCVEIHLVSREEQTVRIGDQEIHFEEGESIHTESAYKYTVEEFRRLASRAGYRSEKTWTDGDQLFSVHYLTVAES